MESLKLHARLYGNSTYAHSNIGKFELYPEINKCINKKQKSQPKNKTTGGNNKTERKNKQTVPEMHINAHEEKRLNMQKKDISSHNKGQTWKKTLNV